MKLQAIKKIIITSSLITSSLFLAGCSEYLNNINIPNPFEQKEAKSADAVYYGHFNDIPIPVDMEKDTNNTKVVFYNQSASGIEIYEGRVEINSLSLAMEQNLLKNNWTLIAKEHDEKIMHIYQKDNRFAIITMYNQTITTGMDVWVLDKLPQNLMNSSKSLPKTTTKTFNDNHLTPNSKNQNAMPKASETIDTTIDNLKKDVSQSYDKTESAVEKKLEDATITIDTTKEEVKEEIKEASSDIII